MMGKIRILTVMMALTVLMTVYIVWTGVGDSEDEDVASDTADGDVDEDEDLKQETLVTKYSERPFGIFKLKLNFGKGRLVSAAVCTCAYNKLHNTKANWPTAMLHAALCAACRSNGLLLSPTALTASCATVERLRVTQLVVHAGRRLLGGFLSPFEAGKRGSYKGDTDMRTGFESWRGRSRIFARWSAGFLGNLQPFHSSAAQYSPRFTYIGSGDPVVKSRPYLFTALYCDRASRQCHSLKMPPAPIYESNNGDVSPPPPFRPPPYRPGDRPPVGGGGGILTGPNPSWERRDPGHKYRDYDHCKCAFSFNCASPGILFQATLETSAFSEALLKFYFQDIPPPRANYAYLILENYTRETTHHIHSAAAIQRLVCRKFFCVYDNCTADKLCLESQLDRNEDIPQDNHEYIYEIAYALQEMGVFAHMVSISRGRKFRRRRYLLCYSWNTLACATNVHIAHVLMTCLLYMYVAHMTACANNRDGNADIQTDNWFHQRTCWDDEHDSAAQIIFATYASAIHSCMLHIVIVDQSSVQHTKSPTHLGEEKSKEAKRKTAKRSAEKALRKKNGYALFAAGTQCSAVSTISTVANTVTDMNIFPNATLSLILPPLADIMKVLAYCHPSSGSFLLQCSTMKCRDYCQVLVLESICNMVAIVTTLMGDGLVDSFTVRPLGPKCLGLSEGPKGLRKTLKCHEKEGVAWGELRAMSRVFLSNWSRWERTRAGSGWKIATACLSEDWSNNNCMLCYATVQYHAVMYISLEKNICNGRSSKQRRGIKVSRWSGPYCQVHCLSMLHKPRTPETEARVAEDDSDLLLAMPPPHTCAALTLLPACPVDVSGAPECHALHRNVQVSLLQGSCDVDKQYCCNNEKQGRYDPGGPRFDGRDDGRPPRYDRPVLVGPGGHTGVPGGYGDGYRPQRGDRFYEPYARSSSVDAKATKN
ncbi:hypothetical protein PR048_029830 [Dryococelus australis]|uniref:Uncharacterized protein n=1 Tax=Dryococelus australis TaxID=614101 RepID=A0ABQ9G787_9NEOP|nr:hypothetical protein PR048_029830 [Dryococelus australis]